MKNFFLLIILSFIFSCGHRQVILYEATSSPVKASIYVNGEKVCEETPCDFRLNADHIFVGLINSSDGFVCEGNATLDVIPAENTASVFHQQADVNSCLDRDKPVNRINFDLRKEGLVTPFVPNKRIQFGGLGAHLFSLRNEEFSEQNSRKTDFYFSYGKQIYTYPNFLFLGEVVFTKRTPINREGYRIGAIGHFHATEVSYLFLTTGFFYEIKMNKFSSDDILPFIGGGVLLNRKSLYALSRYIFVKRQDANFRVGTLGYDIFVSGGVLYHPRSSNWNTQSTLVGLRFYF